MQQQVARQDVAIGFGAALRVYGVCHIVQLVQKVKSVEHEHERTLGCRVCHACVPHKVGGVHHLVHVASAGVEVQVGRQSEVAWQLEHSAERVVDVGGVYRCESGT